MARKSGKGINKFLNFIGLVDDGDPRDTYGEEYQSDNYGRQDAYAPQRNTSRARAPQQEISQRRSSYEPTRAPRMNRTAAYSGRFDDSRSAYAQRGTNGRGQMRSYGNDRSAAGYDYSPRRTTSRFGTFDERTNRYEEAEPARNPENLPQVRTPNRDSRSRTVMYSLHALTDCPEVIDNLIRNNTVILTMEDLDETTRQRSVDTLSGAVFALHATIRKASQNTYLIAPQSVEVNDSYETDRRF